MPQQQNKFQADYTQLMLHQTHTNPMTLDYTTLKTVHIMLVSASVSLFFARWLGVLNEAAWPMQASARWGSMFIDTCLLLVGISLWHLLDLRLWDTPWLLTKLLLLPVYVVLGSFALKRGAGVLHKFGYGLLAFLVVGQMIAIAVYHHPLGRLSQFSH